MKNIFIFIILVILIILLVIGCVNSQEEDIETTSKDKKDFHIMTAYDNAPIGCEYGIDKDNKMNMEQMLEELEQLSGFTFYESQMLSSSLYNNEVIDGIYIDFDFIAIDPEKIVTYYIIGDEVEHQYTVGDYPIKLPTEAGVYNFFSQLIWNSEDQETVFFRVTVKKDL